MIKEANIDELALLLAISNSSRAAGSPASKQQIDAAVAEYLASHTATEDAAGVVKIGHGITVDENGVASLDQEVISDIISDILDDHLDLISDDEVSNLWP